MEPIQCFFVEPTGRAELYLRRYSFGGDVKCVSGGSYHNAMALLGDVEVIYEPPGEGEECPRISERPEDIPHSDPRWPVECVCGYKFQEDDCWQLYQESVYIRRDTGEEFSIRHLPAGAMYFADWMLHQGKTQWRGPDGRCLVVMVPGKDGRAHEWMVDGRCNDCTLPADDAHRCWIRHGDPKTGRITVDKRGVTCNAGAGSIQTEVWHGFLTDGFLRAC